MSKPEIFTLLTLVFALGCGQDECERLSDCDHPAVCIQGRCRPGFGGDWSLPRGDAGATETGMGDAAIPDAASDAGDIDSGATDARSAGRAELRLSTLRLAEGASVADGRAEILDDEGARFERREDRFASGTTTCVLSEEALVEGSVRALVAEQILVEVGGRRGSLELEGEIYLPSEPLPTLSGHPFVVVRVVGSEDFDDLVTGRSLLDGAPVLSRPPDPFDDVEPRAGVSIELARGATITWSLLGFEERVAFEAWTDDAPRLELVCSAPSGASGVFVPAEACASFEARRGGRAARAALVHESRSTLPVLRPGRTLNGVLRLREEHRYRLD